MAEEVKAIELPFGKLVPTVHTNKETGKIDNISFRGSAQELRAWDLKEFGIDDAQRKAMDRRNTSLGTQMSDFLVGQALEIIKKDGKKVDPRATITATLGMGNGAETFAVRLFDEKHYPIKHEDGTSEVGTKEVYGQMTWKTQRMLAKEVREHHEANAGKIEEAMAAIMAKASVK